MVSQQQATASISAVGLVLLYVLWSMVQTGSFLPYVAEGTPHVGNIMVFLVLTSLISGALLVLFGSLIMTLLSWVRKREAKLEGQTIFSWLFVSSFLIFIALFLHIFKLIPLWVSLLSYALVCSIVVYGKFKDKNRYKKYLTGSASTGKGENPVKV